jgi:hypothetical protein
LSTQHLRQFIHHDRATYSRATGPVEQCTSFFYPLQATHFFFVSFRQQDHPHNCRGDKVSAGYKGRCATSLTSWSFAPRLATPVPPHQRRLC